jgi:hypothetical protein
LANPHENESRIDFSLAFPEMFREINEKFKSKSSRNALFSLNDVDFGTYNSVDEDSIKI